MSKKLGRSLLPIQRHKYPAVQQKSVHGKQSIPAIQRAK